MAEEAHVVITDQEGVLPETRRSEPGEPVRSEVILERHPNRAVKVERHVAQDSRGNYFNHGRWTCWDEQGAAQATGEYRQGKRHGKWVRWHDETRGAFAQAPFDLFEAPFVSEATFVDDQLDGPWTICDARGRAVCLWNFSAGELHGKSATWYPDGQRRSEAEYRHGQLDGQMLAWSLEEETPARRRGEAGAKAEPAGSYTLSTKVTYEDGRRNAEKLEYYPEGHKKMEGWYLHARETLETTADFWTGTVKTTVVKKEGSDERHGRWTWWYPDGGKQMEGEYRADKPAGVHVWWFRNGQKQAEGGYEAGEPSGRWVWWHENGQKHVEGEYVAGVRAGVWTMWDDLGQVVRTETHSGVHEVLRDLPQELVIGGSEVTRPLPPPPVQAGQRPQIGSPAPPRRR